MSQTISGYVKRMGWKNSASNAKNKTARFEIVIVVDEVPTWPADVVWRRDRVVLTLTRPVPRPE